MFPLHLDFVVAQEAGRGPEVPHQSLDARDILRRQTRPSTQQQIQGPVQAPGGPGKGGQSQHARCHIQPVRKSLYRSESFPVCSAFENGLPALLDLGELAGQLPCVPARQFLKGYAESLKRVHDGGGQHLASRRLEFNASSKNLPYVKIYIACCVVPEGGAFRFGQKTYERPNLRTRFQPLKAPW